MKIKFENKFRCQTQNSIYYKQHPLNINYRGVEDSRDWLTSVKGYHPSFFSYWNKAKKELKY